MEDIPRLYNEGGVRVQFSELDIFQMKINQISKRQIFLSSNMIQGDSFSDSS